MNRAPVNGLNLELLTELRINLEKAQEDGSKGVILTSSLPTIFSAGLDIMEMYKPDIKKATAFWHALQDTWLTLHGLEIPTVAAINVSNWFIKIIGSFKESKLIDHFCFKGCKSSWWLSTSHVL